MPSSHLSKSVLPEPDSRLACWTTWIVRELTACVFIFSGFVKAIDPWGTLYKVQDYLSALHLSLWPNLVIVGVFFLCGIEFLLGAFLATGCFRRGSAVLTLLFMCVMLPLTLWIALFDPVADCGCFGDAFILSNWETFWKNVALSLCALWLVRYNSHCRCIIIPAFQWLALLASASFIVIIELIGFVYQPLIDFRPYPIGSSLSISASNDEETDEPEFVFIYRKDGVEREFSIDNLPDEEEGWEFVDRRELESGRRSNQTTETAGAKEFHIWDGDTDVTENVLSDDKDMLILTMPEMGTVSIATVWKINSLYDWATSHDIDMIAVASGSDKEISTWKDLSMPEYPIYTSDDTSIKELVRGNPAVIYTDKGIIKWKSALRSLDSEDFVTDNPVHDPMNFARDNKQMLLYITYFYLLAMILLIMISFVPSLRRVILRISKKNDSKENGN